MSHLAQLPRRHVSTNPLGRVTNHAPALTRPRPRPRTLEVGLAAATPPARPRPRAAADSGEPRQSGHH